MIEDSKASEQYPELTKLAVKIVYWVSARRATFNALFLIVNTSLLAFVSSQQRLAQRVLDRGVGGDSPLGDLVGIVQELPGPQRGQIQGDHRSGKEP
jgi:hypothetical protein